MKLNVIVVGVAVLAGAAVAYQASGRRPAPPAPPAVAVVSVEELFELLEQRADAKAEVERMEGKLVEERNKRQNEIAALRDQLPEAKSPKERQELEDELALKTFNLEAWMQASMQELEVEKAIRLQYLYYNIKAAIAELAESEGYDLVIMDDSISANPEFNRDLKVSPQMQVLQQITTANVLYVVPRIDITQELSVRMNNQFNAGPGNVVPPRKLP